jgi:hypothetical protein
MKPSFNKLALAALLALSVCGSAQALLITPSYTPQWTGSETANKDADDIAAVIGQAPGTLTELYKRNVDDGSPTGPFAGSYVTTFTPSTDPNGALIDYIGGPSITSSAKYLFVKDGANDPAWYLFNISGWNGTEDLVLEGFWPNQGGISHIAIYGGGGQQNQGVPDGGATLALLGLALSAIAMVRRKLTA